MAALRSGTLVRRLAVASAPHAARAGPLFSPPAQRRFISATKTQQQPQAPQSVPPGQPKPAPYEKAENVGSKSFLEFDIAGKVFVVTGSASRGGRGLGLAMAEGLVEAGAMVHCIDIRPEPDQAFRRAKERLDPQYSGSLEYHQCDVSNDAEVSAVFQEIGAKKQRLDGIIAAAGIQHVESALTYPAEDISSMLATNYTGVFLCARAAAREMFKYKIQGSICMIASMSGIIANRGFIAPVYNSSKAAVIQLARNLAMEWGRVREDGSGGIRVNCLSPGHILTPMVEENLRNGEASREEWENNSMLGRLSTPEEYKAAGLFLLSRASSFMTGQNLIIDGGTTAW
jgi:D-arabinitol 2-dehydrogenase